MADTLTNIYIPPKTLVNLYTESGVSVGTQITIQNIGNSDIWVNSSATGSNIKTAYNTIPPYGELPNETGDAGAFAYSIGGTVINVRVS